MKVNGSLDLQGNFLSNFALAEVFQWPEEPKVGTFIFKDKRIYVCINIETDIPVWLPMSNELSTYVHDEPQAASVWHIEHDLATSSCIVQIMNGENFSIEPDSVEFLYNHCVISFAEPQAGRAVLVHGATEGIARQPVAFQQVFEEAALWVVQHNLGYPPVVRAFSGMMEIQPLMVVHSEDMKSTALTFSSPVSGRVRCV